MARLLEYSDPNYIEYNSGYQLARVTLLGTAWHPSEVSPPRYTVTRLGNTVQSGTCQIQQVPSKFGYLRFVATPMRLVFSCSPCPTMSSIRHRPLCLFRYFFRPSCTLHRIRYLLWVKPMPWARRAAKNKSFNVHMQRKYLWPQNGVLFWLFFFEGAIASNLFYPSEVS